MPSSRKPVVKIFYSGRGHEAALPPQSDLLRRSQWKLLIKTLLFPGFSERGERRSASASHEVEVEERCLWICSENKLRGHCNPRAVTQLLWKPTVTERPFHKTQSCCLFYPTLALFNRRFAASTCLLSIQCQGLVVRWARVCSTINERLRPVRSDAGNEVVALVVKTNTPGWRR